MKEEPKKKGFLAAIWESMTKTGGCCGGGGDCCGAPSTAGGKEQPSQKDNAPTAPRT